MRNFYSNNFLKDFKIRRLAYLILFFSSINAFATKTIGRLTLGVSTATERFSNTDFGSDKNDSFLSSQRIFYKISDYGPDKWEFTTDLRNKYDAFDKLNKEQMQLDSKDEFQARQLFARWINPQGEVSATAGRFQVSEAGSVFVDGISTLYRFDKDWYAGIFGGLNPKQIDKSYLVSDSKAQHAGAYLTYQPKNDGWDTNQYLTHGFVQQTYDGITERQFIFHNGIYQWQENSRIISLAYFDFVPVSYVQTLNLIFQQEFSKYFSTEVSGLGIDVIEYQRRQNVLEKLNPSPYKEGHVGFEYKYDKDSAVNLSSTSGVRSADQLKRNEVGLGYRLQNFISKNWDTQVKLTSRKNFTSQDLIVAWGLGYFSKSYEANLDLDYAIQKNDDGSIKHPQTVELGLTSFFSKELFATLSFERAADESVTILGTFLKIGYRFGNQDIPPIRDGAPPRGSL